MKYDGFIGGSAGFTAVNVEAERTVNLIVEIIDAGTPENRMWLMKRPGYAVFCNTLGPGPTRCLFYQDGRCFCVSGTGFYEIFTDGTSTQWGIVTADDQPAYIASNGQIGNQLLVVSAGSGYIFSLLTNTLTNIVAAGFPPFAVNAIFADAYFLSNFANEPRFAFSALADGTSWSGLDVAQKSQTSDDLVTMIYDHKELWLIGTKNIEIWFNTGDANNPWTPQPILIQSGIAARNSVAKGDDSVFWLQSGESGALSVVRVQGYNTARISIHAVEHAMAGYSRTDDACAYFYQDEGHGYYVLTFPTADATWVYDVRTQEWHERGFWDASEGVYHADLGCTHCFAATFQKHLVGSRVDGTVYWLSRDEPTDAGVPIRWMRRAPHIAAELKRVFINRFEIGARINVGSTPGPGTDPHIWMRMSRDGGNTWTNERTAQLGPYAQTFRRLFWTRCGYLRTGLFEVAGDGDDFVGLYDAFLETTAGAN